VDEHDSEGEEEEGENPAEDQDAESPLAQERVIELEALRRAERQILEEDSSDNEEEQVANSIR
jgi:hypothetical protein